MASSGKHNVPEDLLIEFLLRLPVKSLLRFKCVCKRWYASIQSSTFIIKHFHHHGNHARLLCYHCIYDPEKWAFALFPDKTLAHEPPLHQHLDYLQLPDQLGYVIGPINGLFLLAHGDPDHDHLALWNPATREFRRLCLPHSNVSLDFIPFSHVLGFGFDPLTNDYKVVSILNFCDDYSDNPFPSVVTLYTLGSDSWKHLDPPVLASIDRLADSSHTTYLNGAYYWLSGDNTSNYMIVLFDMGSDVFREMEGPHNLESKHGNLVFHNDSIALFVYDLGRFRGSIDLWVMKEEGCWTKKLTVGSHVEINWLLGFWKNDELFLETRTMQLILYNPYTHEIRNLGIQGHNSALLFNYKESLVSLKGGNKEWERSSLSDIVQDFCTFHPRTGEERCQYCDLCVSCFSHGACILEEQEEEQE